MDISLRSIGRPNWVHIGFYALLATLLATGWMAVAYVIGRTGLQQAAAASTAQSATLAQAVTRVGVTNLGTKIQVTLATPEYYLAVGMAATATEVGADKYLVFLVTEENHSRTAPAPIPTLLVDGVAVPAPLKERVLTDSEHHRARMLRFLRADTQGNPFVSTDARSVELLWPDLRPAHNPDHTLKNPLSWSLPLRLPGQQEAAPLTPFLFLALTAGLFAALSPCLVQLTLYYLSTLAGVSLGQGAASPGARASILRTAAWFVAGVVLAYTAGGALAGMVGRYVASSGLLGDYGRPIGIASGAIIIAMGLYTGAAARAPMLCRLPLPALTRFARGKGGLGTLTMGFTIALGCLQCFGGAIFASLLVYVGSLGSPALGAAMLFLFSLGVAVPFLLAALAWEQVVPQLRRLERAAPYLALGSSALMILFGVLMIADRFHWVSGLVLQWLPFLQA